MLSVKRQVAAKIEAIEGTPENLAAVDAKILAFDPKIVFEPDRLAQTASASSLSKRAKLTGRIPANFTYAIQLRGSGTLGTAPEWAKLLRSCGVLESALKSITIGVITNGPFQHGEQVTGGTSGGKGRVVIDTATGTTTLYYVVVSGNIQTGEILTGSISGATATTGSAPVAAGLEYKLTCDELLVPSLTMASYEDGVTKKMRGARGTAVFNFKAGEPCKINFTHRGVKESVSDVAMLSIAQEQTKPPIFQNASLAIGGYAARIGELSIDIGNKMSEDDDANAALGIRCFSIGDREPVGTMNPRMVLGSVNDFFNNWFTDAEKKLDFTIGTVAGNKFRFYMPKIQYDKIEDETRDGIALANISFTLNQNLESGDDELTMLAL